LASASLWLPFLVLLALHEDARRAWVDIWFWPGLIPGRYLFDDLYTPSFGYVMLAHLALWTVLARLRPVVSFVGALLTSTLSAGYFVALSSV
jgi:hypothetical protein